MFFAFNFMSSTVGINPVSLSSKCLMENQSHFSKTPRNKPHLEIVNYCSHSIQDGHHSYLVLANTQTAITVKFKDTNFNVIVAESNLKILSELKDISENLTMLNEIIQNIYKLRPNRLYLCSFSQKSFKLNKKHKGDKGT